MFRKKLAMTSLPSEFDAARHALENAPDPPTCDAIERMFTKLKRQQQMQLEQTYYIPYSYPRSASRQCRWIGIAPQGYRSVLECPQINLPSSSGCSMDRLLISRSGDPQLNGADVFCGRGSTSVVSTGQQISIGLITSSQTPGGNFSCQLTSQAADPPTTNCSCGYKKSNRIIGGQETGVNEFPMMAGVIWPDEQVIRCGATIIDKRYLVTAGHCVAGRSPQTLVVVVGEHDITVDDSPATQGLTVERVIVHPQYSSSNQDYDIALLRVNKDMLFSDRVGPACLPFKFANTDFTARTLTLLGWGTEFFGVPTSNTLQKVDVNVISQSSCKERVSSLTPRQFCTYSIGKDACEDDSGGPALYSDPSTNLLFLWGIISHGRCFAEPNKPDVQTRVPMLLDWIKDNTPGAEYCRK